jgi:molybdate transport system ATP-binding protein
VIEIAVRRRLGASALDVEIRASGRVLAIGGASGAGKTTLLNIIAGLERPDEGRVAVDGVVFVDTAAGVDMAVRKRRAGYVFQEPRLFPHMSVERNLRYGERFARGPRLVGFDGVVDLLGVAPLLPRRPARLSGGEKQRVAIGRALLSQPRLLLLDEPLSALDDARREEILALIEKLRDAFAIPIILVSHRADEVERLASDVVVLDRGKVAETRGGALENEKGAPPVRRGASYAG